MARSIILVWMTLFGWKTAIGSAVGEAETDSINYNRLNTFLIAGGSAYTLALVGLNELWYTDHPRESFHFFDDNSEWKQLDKVGHFYSAYQLGHAGSRVFMWTGMSEGKSYLWGSLMGLLLMVPIEFLDGFSSQYGASWGDLAANAAGAGFLFGQHAAWKEIRIHPKFSFRRTSYPDIRPQVLGNGFREELLKDYNGQTYWLSFDIHKFSKAGSGFPKWLNLALGYGAENMVYANDKSNNSLGFDSYRQYFLSIDFDLTHISSQSRWVNTLIYLVNMVHLPAPSLEFNRRKGLKFHYLYF